MRTAAALLLVPLAACASGGGARQACTPRAAADSVVVSGDTAYHFSRVERQPRPMNMHRVIRDFERRLVEVRAVPLYQYVHLRFRVTTGGSVEDVDVIRSSGAAVVDEAAIHAMQSARFQPALLGGCAVSSWVEIPMAVQRALVPGPTPRSRRPN